MLTLTSGLALLLTSTLAAQQPAAAQPAAAQPPAAAANQPNAARLAADAKLRAQMAIEKPLMTLAEDEAKRKRILITIRKILRDGVLNDETREVIDEWIAWRLERMTITEIPKPPKVAAAPMPKAPMAPMPGRFPMPGEDAAPAAPPKVPLPPLPYRRRLAEFNRDFLQEIRGAAKFETAPAKSEAFRRYVLDGIIKKARELFDNNFYVRLNVIMLLERLNLEEGNIRGVGRVAYAPVSAPLLEILRDPDQHEAVKIRAVTGLKRILEIGRPKRELTNEIALEFIAQLEQEASMYWYPMRLVDALGSVDEPLITKRANVPVQQPFHVQALAMVMRDPNHHWIVRSEAAKSLGRVSLHSSVNAALLAHEIVVYCSQMSAAFNKEPNHFYWHQCFVDVYLAFKPRDSDEKARIERVKPATLITKLPGQKSISDAYQQILPAVIHVLNQPQVVNNVRSNLPIPPATLEATTTWISENKPSINQIAPGLPALVDPKPTAAKIDAPMVLPAAIVRDN